MSLISLTNISKIYQMGAVAVHALSDISLAIEEGESVSIVGRSGSGKTTLLDVIGCLSLPTSGEYLLNGNAVSSFSEEALAKVRNQLIGFIFQTFHLLPRQTALMNVALPLFYNGTLKSERVDRAKEALKQVGLSDREHHMQSELSGGQQQRVAIARALVTHPKIILADEPTGNLDSKSGAEIIDLLLELHQNGSTLIIITHDTEVAKQAKRKIVIADGKLLQEG
ncbi:MAG: ABC transporter ATP-binding protein [Nitrospirota bacterium]